MWWAWRIWAHCKEHTKKWEDSAEIMLLIEAARDVYEEDFREEQRREEESRTEESAAGSLVAMWLLTAE